jgi:DnaJ-class molecular chaperone
MKNLKVIVKKTKLPCYECSEIGGKPTKKNKCKCCNGTGKYIEKQYFHIYTQKDGTKMCIDGESLK